MIVLVSLSLTPQQFSLKTKKQKNYLPAGGKLLVNACITASLVYPAVDHNQAPQNLQPVQKGDTKLRISALYHLFLALSSKMDTTLLSRGKGDANHLVNRCRITDAVGWCFSSSLFVDCLHRLLSDRFFCDTQNKVFFRV